MIIKISENKKEILRPDDIYRILADYLRSEDQVDRDKEHFWVFHLDCRNKIKLLELVSLGTLNSSLVHPREVFTRAVGERSAQIIDGLLRYPKPEQEQYFLDTSACKTVFIKIFRFYINEFKLKISDLKCFKLEFFKYKYPYIKELISG